MRGEQRRGSGFRVEGLIKGLRERRFRFQTSTGLLTGLFDMTGLFDWLISSY